MTQGTGKSGAFIPRNQFPCINRLNMIGSGFDADDGASLFMAFRGLQRESAAQGQAHHNVAKELTTLVADPFEDWALRYKVCDSL